MGHHSIKVTVDTQGHLVPGGNRAAVDRLDEPSAASIRNPDATSTAAAELAIILDRSGNVAATGARKRAEMTS
jgi:hypothetical protein